MPKWIFYLKQLYVAWSRVISTKKLTVIIIGKDEKYTTCKKNIIYNKVFNEFLQLNYFLFILFFKTIKKILNTFV